MFPVPLGDDCGGILKLISTRYRFLLPRTQEQHQKLARTSMMHHTSYEHMSTPLSECKKQERLDIDAKYKTS